MNFDENLADFGCGLEEEGSMSENGTAFLKAYARTCTVFNHVSEAESEEAKSEVIRKYLDFCYDLDEDGKVKRGRNVAGISVCGKRFESITRPHLPDLTKDSLSTLHMVEFFTHCCINCIHSIEDVREVHEEIEAMTSAPLNDCTGSFRGFKVVSVHSPKFPREKDLASIKAFCTRMRMEHSEVVNDPECLLWNELGVTCWPTICILGPNPDGGGPNLLFNFMGEGQKDNLLLVVKTAMEYFRTKLVTDIDHVKNGHVKDDVSSVVVGDVVDHGSFFRFPGKVAVLGDQLVVSDSGNNRLVVMRSTGHIVEIIGGSRRGCRDGSFNEALFYNPQGIAFESDSIFYVADTGNHAIRKIDMKSKQVSTFVESGRALEENDERVELKSPWDLCFYDSDTMIIAAAGNHRLFGYFFNDKLLFGVQHKKNSFSVIAGSGREENRNNSYIMKASFAQPSGIVTNVCNGEEKCIFIADSESSSIRSVSNKGQVVGIVGGSRDPTDLFAFGDVDGKGVNAKLQHPMGVCNGASPSEIFIADTYNHKIKKIDVLSKECQTFLATGLNEPSGICKDSSNEFLYVADTNNHSIKVIELKTGAMRKMELTLPMTSNAAPTEKYDKCFELLIHEDISSTKLNVFISPLPDAYEGGQWKVISDEILKVNVTKGLVDMNKDNNNGQFSFSIEDIPNGPNLTTLSVTLDIFFCGPSSCIKRTRKIKITCNKCEHAPKGLEQTLNWEGLSWET